MIDDLARRLGRLALEVGVSALEPTKDTFRTKTGHLAAVTRRSRSTRHDQLASFASPKRQDDVLYASLTHLEHLDREDALVMFGRRRGSANVYPLYEDLWRGVGEERAVDLTPRAHKLIANHVGNVDRSDILVVHNHPAHWMKSLAADLVGWPPTPSSRDRELAFLHTLRWLRELLPSGRDARVHWYLVDRHQLKEFFLPPVDWILARLDETASPRA